MAMWLALSSLALSFSIIGLQLGFSYWVSVASFGALLLVALFLCSGSGVSNIKLKRSDLVLLAAASILSMRILVEEEEILLLQLRLIFFLYLFTLALLFPLSGKKLLSFAIVPSIALSAILACLFLIISYCVSLIPGGPLNPISIATFHDHWLVQNKMFENIDAALLSFKYTSGIARLSLFYGEPSYLSLVMGMCSYIILLLLSFPLSTLRCLFPRLTYLSRTFLFIVFFLSLCFLLRTLSLIGLLFVVFLVSYFFFLCPARAGYSPYRKTMSLIILLIPVFSFAANPMIFSLFTERIISVLSGTDPSAGGRIYALSYFMENLFGYGSIKSSVLASSDYYQVDSGIVAHTLIYGVTFLIYCVFTVNTFRVRFGRFAYWSSYSIYIFLAWSQNGQIFHLDKFFLSVLPIPILVFLVSSCSASKRHTPGLLAS
jgi:hypothetical protein